jgi:hypothetical protein
MKKLLISTLIALSAVAIPLGSTAATFTLDTSRLVGNSAGPFSLDFQFIKGSSSSGAGVTLNNFNFNGGSLSGSPETVGDASGSFSSAVTLTDQTSFYNSFTQKFIPGSVLSFDYTITPGAQSSVPDVFTFGLLDKSSSGIPTTGLSSAGADVFLAVTLNADGAVTKTFTYDESRLPVAGGIPPVPEPGSFALLLVGLVALMGLRGFGLKRGAQNPSF